MKYLITGLGNIGQEYLGTRHNIGFRVVNRLAESQGVSFSEERYGAIARTRVKNCELVLLKPNTFMNLSGNAVRYWLQKENIPIENLLIVVDDIALPFGTHSALSHKVATPVTTALRISRNSWVHKTTRAFASASATIIPRAGRSIMSWAISLRSNSSKCLSCWTGRPRSSRASAWPAYKSR